MSEPVIIRNAIRCPDGTVIESKHHYHYVEHKQEDGRFYAVDGGKTYQRILHSDNQFENLLVNTESPHVEIRQYFKWTSHFDSEMKKLPKPVTKPLCELTDEHLIALYDWTADGYADYVHKIIKDELDYRGLKYE